MAEKNDGSIPSATTPPAQPATTPPAQPATPPAAPVAAAPVVDISDARAEGYADAKAISEICTIAGQPELINKFIQANNTQAEVREYFTNARASADEKQSIDATVTAPAGTGVKAYAPGDGPVAKAAEKIAARMQSVPVKIIG